MPTSPVPEGRHSKRTAAKQRASLIINLDRNQQRIPCLVMDATDHGFRLHGTFHLKRGQPVELILEDDPYSALRCTVVWIGRAGSKQQGEVGVERIQPSEHTH